MRLVRVIKSLEEKTNILCLRLRFCDIMETLKGRIKIMKKVTIYSIVMLLDGKERELPFSRSNKAAAKDLLDKIQKTKTYSGCKGYLKISQELYF